MKIVCVCTKNTDTNTHTHKYSLSSNGRACACVEMQVQILQRIWFNCCLFLKKWNECVAVFSLCQIEKDTYTQVATFFIRCSIWTNICVFVCMWLYKCVSTILGHTHTIFILVLCLFSVFLQNSLAVCADRACCLCVALLFTHTHISFFLPDHINNLCKK